MKKFVTALLFAALVAPVPSVMAAPLDNGETHHLVFMREEEKLARDVYLTLSWWYDMPVFPNIARSEQQHMNLVALMLDRYDLPDPAEGNGIGLPGPDFDGEDDVQTRLQPVRD